MSVLFSHFLVVVNGSRLGALKTDFFINRLHERFLFLCVCVSIVAVVDVFYSSLNVFLVMVMVEHLPTVRWSTWNS